MHVNRDRGDTTVWPGTRSLALMMGVSRGDKVTGWLNELVDIGALEIQRKNMPRHNIYVVHVLPPPDYARPVSLKQWYTANAAFLEEAKAAEKAKRDARRKTTKPQVNTDTPDSGCQSVDTTATPPVTPDSGERSRDSRGTVAPDSGREQDLKEQDLKEQDLTPPGLTAGNGAREAAPQPGGDTPELEPRPELQPEPAPSAAPVAPETGPVAPSEPVPAAPGGTGTPGVDPRRTEAFTRTAAEIAVAGGWDRETVEHVMLDLLAAGRSHAEIAAVLRTAAAGGYGETGSPRRFLRWWPPTMEAAVAAPEWAQGPFAYLAPERARCRLHQGEPEGVCGRCKADALAVAEPEAAPHPAEADGLSRRELARLIARNARTVHGVPGPKPRNELAAVAAEPVAALEAAAVAAGGGG
jgi:hypothetical protein